MTRAKFPSDHMTVKPRKALRTMQTSSMLMKVTQLTRQSAKESRNPSSAGRDAVVHLPATFLSVVRRKVANVCCDDFAFPTPFGRCSCVTCLCSPYPSLASSEARVISAGLEEHTKKPVIANLLHHGVTELHRFFS